MSELSREELESKVERLEKRVAELEQATPEQPEKVAKFTNKEPVEKVIVETPSETITIDNFN